jgi:cell division protein FtsA
LGVPKYVGGLADVVKTPRMSTGVGLMLYGVEHHVKNEQTRLQGNSVGEVWARMKAWLSNNF